MKRMGPAYVVPFRRRKKFLTNYRKRLALLKSGTMRFVVRKSNRAIICHFVDFDPIGDKTLFYTHSNELKKYGWIPEANLPTAYLTAFLCGLKAKKRINEAILDIGLRKKTKNSFVIAALKGALDAGISIPQNDEIDEKRIKGSHISIYASSLKKDSEKYKRQFSCYLSANIEPERIAEIFEEVQKKIAQEYKE